MNLLNNEDTGIIERGEIGSVNESSQGTKKGAKFVILAVAVVAAGLLVWMTWENEDTGVADDGNAGSGIIRTATPFVAAPIPIRATPQFPAPQIEPIVATPAPALEPEINELLESSRRAPVIAFAGRALTTDAHNSSSQGNAELLASLAAIPGTLEEAPTGLEALLQPTQMNGVRARVLGNLHMIVPRGTHIPCTLETAMSSDQPGLVTCIVERDVLSASGQVVLAEKGSRVFGQYEGGIERGQRRMFVLWTELRTPQGVVVALDSPGSDTLGRSGFTGRIDRHFWERFGGAILLSIVSDASAFAFEQAAEAAEFDFGSSSSAPDDAVAIATEESINIQPTLYKNQGEAVNVFVARDLDFSDVYRLRRTETLNEIYDRTVITDVVVLPEWMKE